MKKVRSYAALAGVVLFAIAAAAGIGGCAKKAREHPETDALTVMVRRDETVEKFQEKFPDIPFEFHYYDGKNPTAELQMLAKHHDITDIYIGNLLLDGEKAEENLMDLSGYSFCDAFNPSLLNQCDIGGHIYQIPMALTIRCIIYNKEMFDTYGWEEPKTFDELTALCRRIREETDGVTPIVFGGADIGYYFTTMATFAQTEFLYTPKGQTWERSI